MYKSNKLILNPKKGLKERTKQIKKIMKIFF